MPTYLTQLKMNLSIKLPNAQLIRKPEKYSTGKCFKFAMRKEIIKKIPGGGTEVIALHNAQQTFVAPPG